MEQEKLTNTQTFFKSFINNKILFERRKNSIFFPIIILMIIVALLVAPSYISSSSVDSKTLMKKFPGIQEPMEEILTSSLDCSVKSGIFSCSEDSPALNIVIGERPQKYTVIVNQKIIAKPTEILLNAPQDTDNLIILYSQTIQIRYAERDYVNDTVNVYELVGDYSNLEGFSIKKIAQEAINDPSILTNEINSFVMNAYKSTLKINLITNLATSIISFLLLVLVTCIILKGCSPFKFKKGFKFSECFKLSLTSALPAIIISIFASLIFGFSMFANIFGLLFVGRIMFIYFKYIFNNKIFKELYETEKEERFKF